MLILGVLPRPWAVRRTVTRSRESRTARDRRLRRQLYKGTVLLSTAVIGAVAPGATAPRGHSRTWRRRLDQRWISRSSRHDMTSTVFPIALPLSLSRWASTTPSTVHGSSVT